MRMTMCRELKRDSLNAIRRLAIHHAELVIAQLHSITVAVVAEVACNSGAARIL